MNKRSFFMVSRRRPIGWERGRDSLDQAAFVVSPELPVLTGLACVYLMVQLESDGALHRPFPFTSNRQPL